MILKRIFTTYIPPQLYRQFSIMARSCVFRQLFDEKTWTYTYLLGDPKSKEALLIDPVLEQVERDSRIVEQLGLKLKYAVNTHVHADHVTGSGTLKQKLGCQSGTAGISGAVCDLKLKEGDVLKLGDQQVDVLSTPGHTDGCLTFVFRGDKMAFTGDALFIRGCGRTDFQQGSPDKLYSSIHDKIYKLGDDFEIYPGHNYKGEMKSTVWEEKKYNPRLTKSKAEFADIMNNLGLAKPRLIEIAVPANMVDGVTAK